MLLKCSNLAHHRKIIAFPEVRRVFVAPAVWAVPHPPHRVDQLQLACSGLPSA
ncbi:hypothetical protein GCM10010250_46350 [Streptomyces althioticus]|nr:hypothetical protein GCM10010250_46350 [Streptomyces althioticus]GGQ81416.1 hypothetical protein GCM10010267_50580 [Streptomyces griseorubens]